MTDNEDRTCSCDCVTLRRRLAELREEQREIAALFGLAPCDEDRPPTWTNGERGWMTLREALRPFAAALDRVRDDAARPVSRAALCAALDAFNEWPSGMADRLGDDHLNNDMRCRAMRRALTAARTQPEGQ